MSHVLVIRFSAMGDVSISLPVLSAFSKQYPQHQITVLTKKAFVPMFANLPNCQVIGVDFKTEYSGFLGLLKLFIHLKKMNFDAIADLHSVLRSHFLRVLFWSIGAKVAKIDKGRKEKKQLIKGLIFKELRSSYLRYADVFSTLGFNLSMQEPYFLPKPTLSSKVKNFVNDKKIQVGIAPFAAHLGKQFPWGRFKEVIEKLSQRQEIQIFLLGGGQQQSNLCNEVANGQNIINMIGKVSFTEELQLISHLKLMISMDSGNAHLSAMYGVPTVTIWGVTHPYAGFYPYYQPKNYALLSDRTQFPCIPTSIYGNVYPAGYEQCFSSISVEQIVQKINEII